MNNDNSERFMNSSHPNTSVSERYLQFDLGQESYAVELLSVKEVIPIPETTPFPNTPAYYVGIMNLRGQIISIIDLRSKLKIKSKENNEEAVIIVEIESVKIGVIVDSINKVLNFSNDEVKEVPEINSQVNSNFTWGVYQGEDKLTILLDMKKILNIEEISKLQASAA